MRHIDSKEIAKFYEGILYDKRERKKDYFISKVKSVI